MGFTASAVLLGAFCGAALSPFAARYAARRSAQQPLPYDAAAEHTLVDAGANPALLTLLGDSGVRATHFAHPHSQKTWAELAGDEPAPPDDGDPTTAAAIATLTSEHPKLLDAAVRVVSCHDDRTIYRGAQALETIDGDPPLRRVGRTPGPVRYLVAALWLAAGGTFAGIAATGPVMALTILAVAAYGYICAAIDYDTLYIDMRTFWAGTATLWAGAAAAAATGEIPWLWAVAGLVAVAVWAVALEAANRLYRAIRKRDGMGFGDTLIAVATVGVPTALTGSVFVAVYTVVFAAVLAVTVMLPLLVIRRQGRNTPFAFGPFLAVGWVPAWAIHLIDGVGGLP